MYPIHHENICAESASETDGVGHFDVLEWAGGRFQVIQSDGGMVLHEGTSLDEAIRVAEREAKAFDA
jgi:hypothetical protein